VPVSTCLLTGMSSLAVDDVLQQLKFGSDVQQLFVQVVQVGTVLFQHVGGVAHQVGPHVFIEGVTGFCADGELCDEFSSVHGWLSM
jgi:hypothetical protein